jgi:predicted unusual protein kinase regulating ubiquinone biosynthesis (AarF/ABC1/UbiB family)
VEREDAPGERYLSLFLGKKVALSSSRQVELVDFGATRSYSHAFMDNWLRLLLAAAGQDREACLRWSLELGYLTGEENDVRLIELSPATHLTRCLYSS